MRLALNLGYWPRQVKLPVALVEEADRLGYFAVWVAEAYGSDAVTPLAWLGRADGKDPSGHGHHADAGPHARQCGDDGHDDAADVGRPLSDGPRVFPARRWSKGGTASATAARLPARANMSTSCAPSSRREAPLQYDGQDVPDSLHRRGRDRPGQAAEKHAGGHARTFPFTWRRSGPKM